MPVELRAGCIDGASSLVKESMTKKDKVEEEVQAEDSPKPKVAFITGITGQDGSYLAELLLSKGYQVHGMVRHSSSSTLNTSRIRHLMAAPGGAGGENSSSSSSSTTSSPSSLDGKNSPSSMPSSTSLRLHHGDMTDSSSLATLLRTVQPTEIYNLAAQSHAQVSYELSEYTADVDAMGVLRLLNAIRTCGLEKKVRLFQASSAELFGDVKEVPQSESTPFNPRSPYGIAKLFAHQMVIAYREAYGMFCSTGILYNHESPRHVDTFVMPKIASAVAKIHLGQQQVLELGNMNTKRDWGHARDYVEAMWLMLQHHVGDDFVVATGRCCTVREFVERAFAVVGREIVWQGEGVDEVGMERASEVVRVRCNPKFFRPTGDAKLQRGDAGKAKRLLGWSAKIPLEELAREMVEGAIESAKREMR